MEQLLMFPLHLTGKALHTQNQNHTG